MALSSAVLSRFVGKPISLYSHVYDPDQQQFGYLGDAWLDEVDGDMLLLSPEAGGEVNQLLDARLLGMVVLSEASPVLAALEGGRSNVTPLSG